MHLVGSCIKYSIAISVEMLKYSKTTHTKERMAVDAGWRKMEMRKSKEKAGKGID